MICRKLFFIEKPPNTAKNSIKYLIFEDGESHPVNMEFNF
jgi:hypothetical protein